MVLLLALNVLELTYDMPAIQPSLRDDNDEILVALDLLVRRFDRISAKAEQMSAPRQR